MMENLAGLKLNSVLSKSLGNFFLYHIHLWVTYVMLVHYTTLSIQIAILGDLFMILTIHIHCFYAYALALHYPSTRVLLPCGGFT